MSVKDGLTFPLCLVWKTKWPSSYVEKMSSSFTFMDCRFHLNLKINYNCRNTYDLSIIRTTNSGVLPSFSVKAFYKIDENNVDSFISQRNEDLSSNRLYVSSVDISDIESKIPNFSLQGYLSILCLFEEDNYSILSWLDGQHGVHSSLQSEILLNSRNSSEYSSWATDGMTCSLENLSKDYETLLHNKTLMDAKLSVGKYSIPCHKAVLAARSEVFADMFLKMTKSTNIVLEINDLDLSDLQLFLNYLYCAKLPDDLTKEVLLKLYEVGKKYGVHSLKEECLKEIMKNINEENYLTYLTLVDTNGDQALKDAVVGYIVEDDAFIRSEAWIKFSSENHSLGVEVYQKYVIFKCNF